jgi:hypothetical protein
MREVARYLLIVLRVWLENALSRGITRSDGSGGGLRRAVA